MVLQFYTNLLSLSLRLTDMLNVVQSLESLVLFFPSLCYAIVCMNKKLKSVTYQHLAVDSIACVIYAVINSTIWLIRCGALCAYGYDYWSKVFEWFVFIYFRQTLDVFMMLIEIHLAYVKLQSFRNVQNTNKFTIPLYVRFILFFIYAAGLNIPLHILPRNLTLFGYLITSNNTNVSLYVNDTSSSDLRPLYRLVTMNKDTPFMQWNLISGFMGGVGPLFVYFILQLVLYFRLKSFLAFKRRTLGPGRDKSIEEKEIKSTHRIMVLGVNCVVGYFPNKLANNFLLYALTPEQWTYYIPFSNMLIWLSNGLKFFINFAFDEEFRKVFYTTFHIPKRKPRVHWESTGTGTLATRASKRDVN